MPPNSETSVSKEAMEAETQNVQVEGLQSQDMVVEVADSVPGSSLTHSVPLPPLEAPHQTPPPPPPPSSSEHMGHTVDNGMNLDLLDPLECMDEEVEIDNSVLMNIHETSDDAQTNTTNAVPSQDTHTLPDPISRPHRSHPTPPHTPTQAPPTSQLSQDDTQQLEPSSDSVCQITASPSHSLYNDDKHTTADEEVSGITSSKAMMCAGGEERECGEIGEGVEDMVVIGGTSGDLIVANDTEVCQLQLVIIQRSLIH